MGDGTLLPFLAGRPMRPSPQPRDAPPVCVVGDVAEAGGVAGLRPAVSQVPPNTAIGTGVAPPRPPTRTGRQGTGKKGVAHKVPATFRRDLETALGQAGAWGRGLPRRPARARTRSVVDTLAAMRPSPTCLLRLLHNTYLKKD